MIMKAAEPIPTTFCIKARHQVGLLLTGAPNTYITNATVNGRHIERKRTREPSTG